MKQKQTAKLQVIFFIALFFLSMITQAAEESLETVQTFLKEGNTKEGIIILERIIDKTSNIKTKAKLEGALGWAYVEINEYELAEKYLDSSLQHATAIQDKKTALRANNNMGIALFLQNKLNESRAYFNQDISKNSDTAKTYLELIATKEKELLSEEALLAGVEQRRNKQFAHAIEKYDLALRYRPDDPKILEYKGYAQFRMGSFDEAYQTLQLAKEAGPDRKFTHLNLLKVSCARQSQSDIRKTIEESNLDIDVYRNWYNIDGELQQVCEHNPTFAQMISSQ